MGYAYKNELAMTGAIKDLPMMASAYLPKSLSSALIEMSKELDRLRAEVNELRSKIEKE
jgi:hypothetical protein